MTVYFMCIQQLLLRQHISTDLGDFQVLYHHRELKYTISFNMQNNLYLNSTFGMVNIVV